MCCDLRCPSERPGMNVLFVTADQWRGDCLSCLGHPAVRTPDLDRLAADGFLFERHFAQATPCGPSRASLHTGLYALNTARSPTARPWMHVTRPWPVWWRRRLRSVLFGYRHQRRPAHPARGQPLAAHLRGRGARVSRRAAPGRGGGGLSRSSRRAWLWPPDLRTGLRWRLPAAGPIPCGGQCHAPLADRFLGWLDRQGSEPWFAHVSFIKPHPPFVAPEPWYSAVAPGDVPPPIRAAAPEAEGACTRGSRRIWRNRSRARIGGCYSTRPASHGCARSISG